jgi:hypothetical protein
VLRLSTVLVLAVLACPVGAGAQSGAPPEERHPTSPGTEGDSGSPSPTTPPLGGGPNPRGVPIDEGIIESESRRDAEEDDDALDAEAAAEDAIIPPPPRRPPSDEELEAEEEAERMAEERDEDEPTVIDEDMDLVPDPPDLPEWRLRAGAGVALPTAGEFGFALRLTQDFEWQPRGAEPFLFGIGGSENLGAGLIGQAHARVGLHAWFCDERPVRCQGAVAVVGGAAFGLGNVGPDLAGEVDLRFLFWERLELHARGGFFTLGGVALINITGGLAIAF